MPCIGRVSGNFSGPMYPDWAWPPRGADEALWIETVNEIQALLGEDPVRLPEPMASEHSATAPFALTKAADKMLREARGPRTTTVPIPR